VTTAYIPTVGEYAARALASFLDLQAAGRRFAPSGTTPAARRAAVELVHACLGMMRKFPLQAREDFASVLPLTQLELELIGRAPFEAPEIAEALAQRLAEWASRSPILVDEANVHAADFLEKLGPHLDRWNERQHASKAAAYLLRL
jgi:hypothetical protein